MRDSKNEFHIFIDMKIRYTQEQYNSSLSTDPLSLECYRCGKEFTKAKKHIKHELKSNKGECRFCSQSCRSISTNQKHDSLYQLVECLQCKTQFQKASRYIIDFNHFCSRSCAATYNNTHKTHGTRRSKLEVWLEQQLPPLYPSLEFHFNRKDAINAELDIYIPSLKLAFELNGLFHYEPIFGPKKLAQIQTNDERKFQACLEKGIELCIVDVSSFSYFKLERAKKYLNGIREIIDKKVGVTGLEPAASTSRT